MLMLGGPALAQRGDQDDAWLVLARQTINPGENAGVVMLDRAQMRFSRIRLETKSGAILLYDVRLRYTNDLVEDVDIRQETTPGRNVIEINPRGNAPLRQIEVRFRALPQGASASYQISGEDAELKRILSSYEVIGTERVGGRDRLTFDVGRREGRLTELRLRALDDDIYVRRMEVVFPRGERQDVRVRDRIEPGTVSDAIDLAGDSRFVREVTVELGRRFGGGSAGNGRLQLLARVDRSAPPSRDPVPGIPPGWVQLGEQTAGFRSDRDTIQVGRNVGQFDRIALRVMENDIFLEEVVVVYGNGERDVKRVRQEVPANGRTGVIELKGDRFIDRIELVQRSTGVRRPRAKVIVFGEYSDLWKRRQGRADDRGGDRKEGRGQWVRFGAQRAQMLGDDWDTITVGRDKGRFRAIKIRIGRHDVQIQAIRVVYSNGEVEDLPFSGTIDDGRESPVIDLKGRDRFIERVEVRHRTKFNLKGEGETEVWGLD